MHKYSRGMTLVLLVNKYATLDVHSGLGSRGLSIQFESFKSTSNGTRWGCSYFLLWPVIIFDNYWLKMETAYIDLFSKGDLLMTHDISWPLMTIGMLTMFCRPGSDLCDTQMVKLSASWISTTERWWKNQGRIGFFSQIGANMKNNETT